jgi:branched-chain amino acid transport system permease protein
MFAFTHTPLGRMLNAVRDNPERAAFVGYDPHMVRYLAFVVAGFFAGVSGGLAALNFEVVTADVLSSHRSGTLLLFTFLGGTAFFWGPVVGGVLMVLATVLLSGYTQAWLLYVGLVFVVMVMLAPGGMASGMAMAPRLLGQGRWRGVWVGGAALAATALLVLTGVAALVEMAYHLQLNSALGNELTFAGVRLNVLSPDSWVGAVCVAATGLGLFEVTRRQWVRSWATAQADAPENVPENAPADAQAHGQRATTVREPV